jgi:hypothetical protein
MKLGQFFVVAGMLSVAAIALQAAARSNSAFSAADALSLPPQQNPETMMPEQSEAKARQVLSDLINARGGSGYLEMRESQCVGQRAQFGHNEAVTGYVGFTDSREYPDKARLEYTVKSHNLKSIINVVIGVEGLDLTHGGVIVAVYNGDRGWTLDKSGVTELPVTATAEFQEQTKRNIDNLLRIRLKEPGLIIRYGGIGTADLKEVEWVDITDSEERNYRLAVDHSTRLLVESVVGTVNEETKERDEDITRYTNYQLKDTVWTPMQVSREHNGRRAAQFFYNSCHFNPGFPGDYFEPTSLKKK